MSKNHQQLKIKWYSLFQSMEQEDVLDHSFVEKSKIIQELPCNWNAATCLYSMTWCWPGAITVGPCKTWLLFHPKSLESIPKSLCFSKMSLAEYDTHTNAMHSSLVPSITVTFTDILVLATVWDLWLSFDIYKDSENLSKKGFQGLWESFLQRPPFS